MSRKQNSLMRFTRTERLAQLSEQEIVIEQKKREIQAKIEARRKNQSEQTLKNLEACKEIKNHHPGSSKYLCNSRDNKPEGSSKEEDQKDSLKNAFSNDGSFLDQFKKLSQSGLAPQKFNLPQFTTKSEESINSQTYQRESLPSVSQLNVPVNSSLCGLKMTVGSPMLHTDAISMTFKTSTVKKLDLISNPLNDGDDDDNDDDDGGNDDNSDEDSRHISSKKNTRCQVMETASSNANVSQTPDQGSSRTFSKDRKRLKSNGGTDVKVSHLVDVVTKHGDDYEEELLKENQNESSFRQNLSGEKNTFKGNDSQLKKMKYLMETEEDNGGQQQNSSDSESSHKPSTSRSHHRRGGGERRTDGYQADNEEETHCPKMSEENSQKHLIPFHNLLPEACTEPSDTTQDSTTEKSASEDRRKRKRKSRWGDAVSSSTNIQPPALVTNLNLQPLGKVPAPKTNLLSQVTRSDPGLIQYAKQTFGSTNLSEEDWKKAEDHYKINLLYQDLVKKRAEITKLEKAGKFKYEYDSDEDVEGGTWEHKLRQQEMLATQLWAEELTRQAAGKHHIGDFLPPEELEKFMERYNAVKEGREPDLSDYKEFKLKEDNVGYRLLQKMGWNEGQGLGQDGSGITNPVNKATTRHENQGLGVERPDGLEPGDDEYDAYRKRMMLAYRFRPNPLNNPRRPYY